MPAVTAQDTLSGGATIRPWTVVVSLVGHVALFAGLVAADRFLSPPEPEPLFRESVQVDLISVLPQQQGIMVDKPSRTPDPVEGVKEPEAPPPPPEPPKPDQLTLKDPAKEKPKGEPKPRDRTQDRDRLLREAAKKKALKDMSAPLGSRDQVRTSPDGVDASEAVLGPGGAMSDPVYAAYYKKIRPLVLDQWTVIEGDRRAHPNAVVVLSLKIAADGSLQDPKVYKSSGVSAIDKAAVMAIYKLRKLPAPPAKYAAGWAKGTTFTLRLSDK